MRESFQGFRITSRKALAILIVLVSSCTNPSATNPTPAAVAVPVGQKWYGYDGYWSSVTIRVGSPSQKLDVLVSTQSRETWVVGVGGCDRTSTCRDKRGGLFQSNASSTWQDAGLYELGLDPQLGFGGYARYGYDNVDLDEEIIVPSQVVGVINSTEHWLGFLGLGLGVTNFTGTNKLPFLSSLVENQSIIPSHSYGYTAGAYNRLKHVPASLTLGGYDANRFLPHNISFVLDSYQNPVAAINQITVSSHPPPSSGAGTGWTTNPSTLLGLGEASLFTVDSSTPFLWLPESVCKRFETALGLVYDTNLQLYTFGRNTSQHDALVNWNLTFSFLIADLPGSPKAVNISLPYSAFDLQLSYPFPGLNATSSSPAVNYFPLRKAANSSQYTIGRVFLQEAYLIVDYERNNFSVHQASFASDALTNYSLVNINKPDDSTQSDNNGTTGNILSKGAIVGIVIACAVVVAGIVVILIFCLRRRRSRDQHEKPSSPIKNFLPWLKAKPKEERPSELLGETKYPVEVQAKSRVVEMPASMPQELEGTEVTKDLIPVSGHDDPYAQDPKHPIKPHPDASIAQREYYALEPSPLTPPAYSPSRVGQARHANRHSSTASRDVSRDSSPLTTPGLVSPITPNLPVNAYTQAPQTRPAQLGTEGTLLPHTPTTVSRDVSRESSPLSTPGLVSPLMPGKPGLPVNLQGSVPHSQPQLPTQTQPQTETQTQTQPQTGMNAVIWRDRDRAVGRSDSRVSRFTEEGIVHTSAGRPGSSTARVEAEGGNAGGQGSGEGRRYERYSWEE